MRKLSVDINFTLYQRTGSKHEMHDKIVGLGIGLLAVVGTNIKVSVLRLVIDIRPRGPRIVGFEYSVVVGIEITHTLHTYRIVMPRNRLETAIFVPSREYKPRSMGILQFLIPDVKRLRHRHTVVITDIGRDTYLQLLTRIAYLIPGVHHLERELLMRFVVIDIGTSRYFATERHQIFGYRETGRKQQTVWITLGIDQYGIIAGEAETHLFVGQSNAVMHIIAIGIERQ